MTKPIVLVPYTCMDIVMLEHDVYYRQIVASTEVQQQKNAQDQIREAVHYGHALAGCTVSIPMDIEILRRSTFYQPH